MLFSRRSFLQTSTAAALSSLWPRTGIDPANSELCRKLASDPLRPQYHLLPPHNWMNDPNGPIYFGGRYHMFHQYNPKGAVWGNMHWAHATSPDMIHWQHESIAIAPTPGGPDSDGVFSGSAVLDNRIPAVIYTGVASPASDAEATLRDGVHSWRETQCLAVAQDNDLRTWKKFPEPILATPPPGLPVTGFRDPCLWRENNSWMLALGSGTRDKGGMILLYASKDLHRWTYLHPLVQGTPASKKTVNPVDDGDMWECPDFFPMGDKHVLLISTMGKVRWKVGSYANQIFTPEKEGVVDWGSYYAAKSMLDENGNRILWGWIPETRPDPDLIAAGWAGVMSLPRVLSLNGQDELQMDIIPGIQNLYGEHTTITSEQPDHVRQKNLDSLRIHDLAAALVLQVRAPANEGALHLQSDSGDFATISFLIQSGNRQLRVSKQSAPIPGATGSPISIHLFLDGSVLEIFANKTTALTARVYQIPREPLRLQLENLELISLDSWQMKQISNDRLTGSFCK